MAVAPVPAQSHCPRQTANKVLTVSAGELVPILPEALFL